MKKEFTRIEFEGGAVVVIQSINDSVEHVIRGNRVSGINTIVGLSGMSHTDAVGKTIRAFERKVARKLSH